MKWIAIAAVAVALSGCGEPKPDNSMKGVAAKIRATGLTTGGTEGLFSASQMTPDIKERESSRFLFARFPADDGYVWVRVSHGENESGLCSFQHETIQFSTSGKCE